MDKAMEHAIDDAAKTALEKIHDALVGGSSIIIVDRVDDLVRSVTQNDLKAIYICLRRREPMFPDKNLIGTCSCPYCGIQVKEPDAYCYRCGQHMRWNNKEDI